MTKDKVVKELKHAAKSLRKTIDSLESISQFNVLSDELEFRLQKIEKVLKWVKEN